MALARVARRRESRVDYWPSFVDAMTTLLLVFIFLLTVFMLAQYFLSQEISGKDTALSRLHSQIAELTRMLALERANSHSLEDTIALLQANLQTAENARDELQRRLAAQAGVADAAGGRVAELESALEDQKQVSARAMSQVEILNQQIAALRRQIAALESALDASESRDREAQAKIADLGRRLNVALAQKVQELSRYRSDFFGRLRAILSDRSDIRVVGDRFVFQSEVLFPSGSDQINPTGREELTKLAAAVRQLEKEIPPEINWVIRVDGHTDKRPITGRFASNWELSAARAIAVVKFLIDQGVSPQHLVAAGFGEYQPLEEGDSEAAYAKNRRIEFKLTER